jgi:membrane protease YdiL (CAAX protease family)
MPVNPRLRRAAPRAWPKRSARRHGGASPSEWPAEPAAWQPRTAAARASVVALHLVPGILAYVLLRTVREPLQHLLGVASAEAQIGLIMTGVMLLMGAATFACARLVDGLGPRRALHATGVTRFDPVAIVLAVAIWLAVLAGSSLLGYEHDIRAAIERVDWLALPAWHFQRINGFSELAPLVGGFALVANVVCEELWFRGYLQDKLAFLGPMSWVGGGVLFTLYHVFEAPVAYPGVLGGLALAGLWAARRDLWSCVLLHALLNAPV